MPVFTNQTTTTFLLDPRQDFRKKKIETEIRHDPLTGDSGRLAHFGMIRIEKEDFNVLDTPEARRRCPFCPPNFARMTPRFLPELIEDGYLERGEARVVSNIAPYDQYSALTIMSKKHLLPLKELSGPLLKDAFQAGLEFCLLVAAKDRELPYNIIAWNYMPPSGGGLVHPHQQIIITDFPGNLYRKVLKGSKTYYQRYGKNYWLELCKKEKETGKRFVGELGQSCWLIPYVPLGVLGEFMVVFPQLHTIHDLKEEGLNDLTAGLQRLFKYFETLNIYSFNLGLYFAPTGEAENYFSLHARIVPRTFLNLKQRPPDTNFFHLVLQEPYTVVLPESQCAELKPFFEK